jgi:hypothetical protein
MGGKVGDDFYVVSFPDRNVYVCAAMFIRRSERGKAAQDQEWENRPQFIARGRLRGVLHGRGEATSAYADANSESVLPLYWKLDMPAALGASGSPVMAVGTDGAHSMAALLNGADPRYWGPGNWVAMATQVGYILDRIAYVLSTRSLGEGHAGFLREILSLAGENEQVPIP